MVPRRHFFAACWRAVRSSSEINKTLYWLTKIEVRPCFERTKNQRNFDVGAVRSCCCLPNALGARPGVVWMARGGSPDAPRGDLGPTWGRPGRPKSALGPSRTRPGALLGASPDVRGGPPSAPGRPTEDFSCFFVVSGPIFVDSDELFGRSRCLRHLYGGGPESPSSIFLQCAPIVEYRSAVPADTALEGSSVDPTSMRSCKCT